MFLIDFAENTGQEKKKKSVEANNHAMDTVSVSAGINMPDTSFANHFKEQTKKPSCCVSPPSRFKAKKIPRPNRDI